MRKEVWALSAKRWDGERCTSDAMPRGAAKVLQTCISAQQHLTHLTPSKPTRRTHFYLSLLTYPVSAYKSFHTTLSLPTRSSAQVSIGNFKTSQSHLTRSGGTFSLVLLSTQQVDRGIELYSLSIRNVSERYNGRIAFWA